jgi:fructokinase
MERTLLLPLIRAKVRRLLNGYLASPVLSGTMEEYIVPPALGKRSGVLGALALAKRSA